MDSNEEDNHEKKEKKIKKSKDGKRDRSRSKDRDKDKDRHSHLNKKDDKNNDDVNIADNNKNNDKISTKESDYTNLDNEVKKRDDSRERDRSGRRRSPDYARRSDYRRGGYRSRSPEYNRKNDRRRYSRSRSPDRNHRSRRDRSYDRSYDRDRRRDRERSNDRNIKSDDNNHDIDSNVLKPITLTEVMKSNPGLSMPEAIQKMNLHNQAASLGLSSIPPNGIISSLKPNGSSSSNLTTQTTQIPIVSNVNSINKPIIASIDPETDKYRELYVGNLPAGVTNQQLSDFFNTAMKQLKLSTEDCIISAWINTSGFYGFVVFKSVDEATGAMTHLNGMQIGTSILKIGRPHTPKLGLAPGQVGIPVGNPLLLNSIPTLTIPPPPKTEILSNCIMVTNIPTLINEMQIKELLNAYGKLKAFNLIKNSGGETQISVLEYEDNSVTEAAMKGLEEITLGKNKLIVQRVPVQNVSLLLQPTNLQSSSQDLTTLKNEINDPLTHYPTTNVIRLLNMVTSEDLSDDELYMELLEDVGEECNSHGTVKSIQIPRSGNGVGEVFVHFLHQIGAVKTKEAIAGRSYAGKIVYVTFYPEELFESKTFRIPDDYNLKTNFTNTTNTVLDIDDL